jgi:hypothetical protein
MAESRVLDDIEELIIPGAIAIGGIYIVWWLGRYLDRGYHDVTNIPNWLSSNLELPSFSLPEGTLFEEAATPLREGGLIDRWTISPREWYSIGKRAKSRIGRWTPW